MRLEARETEDAWPFSRHPHPETPYLKALLEEVEKRIQSGTLLEDTTDYLIRTTRNNGNLYPVRPSRNGFDHGAEARSELPSSGELQPKQCDDRDENEDGRHSILGGCSSSVELCRSCSDGKEQPRLEDLTSRRIDTRSPEMLNHLPSRETIEMEDETAPAEAVEPKSKGKKTESVSDSDDSWVTGDDVFEKPAKKAKKQKPEKIEKKAKKSKPVVEAEKTETEEEEPESVPEPKKRKAKKKYDTSDGRHEGSAICISMTASVYEPFEKIREKIGLSRSKAIAQALEPWIKKHG